MLMNSLVDLHRFTCVITFDLVGDIDLGAILQPLPDPDHNEKQQQDTVEHEEDHGELPDVLHTNARVGLQARNVVGVRADLIVRDAVRDVANPGVSKILEC